MNTDTETQVTVLLAIEDNQGYSPDQVRETMTLGDLIAELQAAAEEHGEDARVVLENGQQYGARFGGISTYRDLITAVVPDEDEDEDDDEDEDF